MNQGTRCLLLLSGLALAAGCGGLTDIEARLARMERAQREFIAEQRRWNERTDDELKHAWASAFCKEDVQIFLRQCREAEKEKRRGETIDPGVCPAKKKDHILTFMSTQRHEVLYFLLRDGLKKVPAYRIDAVRQLVRRPWLTTTRFLVLGRPVEGLREGVRDAEARVKVVEQLLMEQLKIPADRIMGPWTFSFGVTDDEIDKSTRPNDIPQRGEPKARGLGVWLFRVDC